MKTIKIADWEEIPKNFTGIIKFRNKFKLWLEEGKYHRLDGPAKEWSNGYKEWWIENCRYPQINLIDFMTLDHYKGKHGIMWYKILTKDEIVEYPDIPGLIEK